MLRICKSEAERKTWAQDPQEGERSTEDQDSAVERKAKESSGKACVRPKLGAPGLKAPTGPGEDSVAGRPPGRLVTAEDGRAG